MSFTWHPEEDPPRIESHSKAKLNVLRRYLRAYFDRLNVSPHREQFKLDLIDGFAGGGTFRDAEDVISGTPLIMLEEASEAISRLNRNRNKKLHIDCTFYFIDKNKAHIDHLRKALAKRGYDTSDGSIVVRNSLFENEIEGIILSIHKRQPRAGRALFLLDQTGFSQVQLDLVSQIFNRLSSAEVILTFAADALVNHLSQTPQFVKAVAPLQLSEARIRDLIRYKEGDGGRALVQRAIRDRVRKVTGAAYDTPFFIRPRQSRRALWFLHLARHPTARDVMIQQHWDIHNTFQHYGHGDLSMLGWDALRECATLPLFEFRESDANQMRDQLLNALPRELFGLVSEMPVTMDAFRHRFANRTAARFSDLDQIILRLVEEKEFVILNPKGKQRSRALKHLQSTDRIALPSTLLFPELSRRLGGGQSYIA